MDISTFQIFHARLLQLCDFLERVQRIFENVQSILQNFNIMHYYSLFLKFNLKVNFLLFLEKLLLKIDPTKIKRFSTTFFFGFGAGIFHLHPLSLNPPVDNNSGDLGMGLMRFVVYTATGGYTARYVNTIYNQSYSPDFDQ